MTLDPDDGGGPGRRAAFKFPIRLDDGVIPVGGLGGSLFVRGVPLRGEPAASFAAKSTTAVGLLREREEMSTAAGTSVGGESVGDALILA